MVGGGDRDRDRGGNNRVDREGSEGGLLRGVRVGVARGGRQRAEGVVATVRITFVALRATGIPLRVEEDASTVDPSTYGVVAPKAPLRGGLKAGLDAATDAVDAIGKAHGNVTDGGKVGGKRTQGPTGVEEPVTAVF